MRWKREALGNGRQIGAHRIDPFHTARSADEARPVPQPRQDGRQLAERVAVVREVPRVADVVREVTVGGEERFLPEGACLRTVARVDQESAREAAGCSGQEPEAAGLRGGPGCRSCMG